MMLSEDKSAAVTHCGTLRKPGAPIVRSSMAQPAESGSSKPARQFKGEDIKNMLHKEPFDLSKSICKQKVALPSSQTVLRQVHQLRLTKD